MSFKIVKAAALVMCSTLTFSGASAFAQEAQSLDQLLDFVKKGQVSASKENRSNNGGKQRGFRQWTYHASSCTTGGQQGQYL